MGVLSRIGTGFGIAGRSMQVLREYPRLLAFPALGGLTGLAFLATVVAGLYGTGAEPTTWLRSGPIVYVSLFVAYLVETFLASFFMAGLVATTRTVFEGGEPSVREGLAVAWNRKFQLLVWATIAALVGVLVRGLEESNELLGRLVAIAFSIAWGVMTYFIVPVIVFENPSITGMFSHSAHTFETTWGESLGAMSGVGLVSIVLTILAVLATVVAVIVASTIGPAAVGATMILGIAAIVLTALIGQTLTGIAKTALYVYADEGRTPDAFSDLNLASIHRSSRSAGRREEPINPPM